MSEEVNNQQVLQAIMDLAAGQVSIEQKIEATKSELRQEIKTTKSELRQEIEATKAELKQDIETTKLELKQDIAEVNDKINLHNAKLAVLSEGMVETKAEVKILSNAR